MCVLPTPNNPHTYQLHPDPHHTGKFDQQHIQQVLRAAQWLILLFLIVQIAALITALLMRFFIKPDGAAGTTGFDEAELAEHAVSMQHLRTDVEAARGSSVRNPKYNKVRGGDHPISLLVLSSTLIAIPTQSPHS